MSIACNLVLNFCGYKAEIVYNLPTWVIGTVLLELMGIFAYHLTILLSYNILCKIKFFTKGGQTWWLLL